MAVLLLVTLALPPALLPAPLLLHAALGDFAPGKISSVVLGTSQDSAFLFRRASLRRRRAAPISLPLPQGSSVALPYPDVIAAKIPASKDPAPSSLTKGAI